MRPHLRLWLGVVLGLLFTAVLVAQAPTAITLIDQAKVLLDQAKALIVPPPPVTPPPILSCPANQTAITNGTGMAVMYPAPVVTGGVVPVVVIALPASGSVFQVGVTIVTVTALDSATPRQPANPCNFTVTVTAVVPPPPPPPPPPSGGVVISSVTGTLQHGQNVTVNGSGFGTKATPAPTIWDTAEGTTLGAFWDGWEPTTAASGCNLGYRTPIRNVAPPHPFSLKYLAGCHLGLDTSTGGNQVYFQKSRTAPTYPYYSYWALYWRMDPAWSNNAGENTDGNNKIHIISTSPNLVGTGDRFWYNEYDVRPINPSVVPELDVSNTGSLGYRCRTALVGACHSSGSGQVGYGSPSNNPINGWIKFELLIRWDRTASGYVIMYENGRTVFHTTGETDTYTGTASRTEAFGYYSRARGITTWRYFDDIYFDASVDALAHVEICPGATFATRGACQTQPAVTWSASQITVTLNRGALPAGQAYAYVTDRLRTTNASGFPVTIQ